MFLVGFAKESRIENVFAQTLLDSSYKNAELKVKVSTTGPGKVSIKLLDADRQTIASKEANANTESTTDFSIAVEDPLKWTAESPNLYHLVVSLDSTQFVAHRVGFR